MVWHKLAAGDWIKPCPHPIEGQRIVLRVTRRDGRWEVYDLLGDLWLGGYETLREAKYYGLDWAAQEQERAPWQR